jgi:monoamine oxidase
VIGAGAAGLTAARRLRAAGRSILVVEARARVGGRIHTVRPPEAAGPVELGAEFVHGAAPLTRRILAEAGVSLAPVSGEAWRAERGRVEVGDDLWEQIEGVLGGLDSERDPDRSFADHLRAHRDDIPPADADIARTFVEGFHAADAERVSERSLADEGTEGASDASRIREGYDRLVEMLADAVGRERIVLGRVVRRVVWKPGHVELETVLAEGGGDPALLTARAVIVTVPIGVLKSTGGRGSLRFEPEPAHLEPTLDRLAMGAVVRVTLALDRAPWSAPALLPAPALRDGAPSFVHTPGERFNAFWCTVDGRGLVAWSGGSRARRLPGDVFELRPLAIAALARATGADADRVASAVRGAWVHDWRDDHWSCGGYTYVQVGGVDAPARLARPVEGTLFFAGEATSADSMGTVEGALGSGERAAAATLESLR